MTTVDFRTRFQNDEIALDVDMFVDQQLPELLDAHADSAGRALKRAELPPLTFIVDDAPLRFALDGERLAVTRDASDELVVMLDALTFSDLTQDVVSTFGIQMAGRAQITGSADRFLEWEPVLRTLLDGRPPYESGTIAFHDRNGRPLDLHQSFTLDDDPAEIGHFLAEAGYLHIKGVFTEEEMASVSAELDVAVAEAQPDDGASWWARTAAGESYPSRILGFNQKSPTLRELLLRERFATIGTFTADQFVLRNPERGDSAEGLLKKPGVVAGISDSSWHKDCSLGGHTRRCCGLTTGISVTGARKENGELGVVAGSHRANVPVLGNDLDLPAVPLPTQTGDVTVHCSCTLHMSRPPVSAERRVVYTDFDLAPRRGDRVVELSEEEIRASRSALSSQVDDNQANQTFGARAGNYDL